MELTNSWGFTIFLAVLVFYFTVFNFFKSYIDRIFGFSYIVLLRRYLYFYLCHMCISIVHVIYCYNIILISLLNQCWIYICDF